MLRKRLIDTDSTFNFCIESLEQRRLLAGNVLVDVNGDDLSIRGDTADNELEVHVTGGTIWVAGVNGTTLTGDAVGSGDDFDTGIAAKELDKFKAVLKKGNDRLTFVDSIQINGRATISLSGGDDEFLIDGAGGRSATNFTIRGASGNDLVELDGWSFDGKANVALSGGDDTLGISLGSTIFADPKTRLIGGGGVDELAPLAGDSDFGTIPVGVDLVVTTGDVLREFAPGAVGIDSLGVVQKSFETVTSDANLTASDITFTAATINGAASSLTQAGFSYAAGAGTDGVLNFATAGAPGFAGLGISDTANVEIAFNFTVAGQAQAGVLRYAVSGAADDYQATVDFLGPAVEDQEVEVTVVAGIGEALLDIDILGTADLSETVAAVDFQTPTAALNGLAESATLTIAGAFAADNSDGMATATNNSVAMAGADQSSGATAVAFNDSFATASALEQSTVFASGSEQSSATAFGGDNGTANAVAVQDSIANAVAIAGSAASANAENGSDTLSLAINGSAADAVGLTQSSASATAENSSVATANAQVGSTATAQSIQIGSATAVASEDSVASAEATDTSISTAFATMESAATATADATSDAQAIAVDNSSAEASAVDRSGATADAENDSNATATALAQSTVFAGGSDQSSATAFGENSGTANAVAKPTSIANAIAIESSAASAVAEDGSDALSFANNGSAADSDAVNASSASASADTLSIAIANAEVRSTSTATASQIGSATAVASEASAATADSMNFVAVMNMATIIPAMAFADDFANPVQTVVFSGLPAGTVLSGGTSNVDGTEWTFAGSPAAGLTLTPPLGFAGAFELTVTATDGTATATSVQSVVVA